MIALLEILYVVARVTFFVLRAPASKRGVVHILVCNRSCDLEMNLETMTAQYKWVRDPKPVIVEVAKPAKSPSSDEDEIIIKGILNKIK